MQLRCLPGFTKDAIKAYARANIAPGSRVLSDGLNCFKGIVAAGLARVIKITGSGRPKGPDFKWINTGLGNVQSAIKSTLRSCDARRVIWQRSNGVTIAVSSWRKTSNGWLASP